MRIKLRYLVRSGGPNFIPSVRGPVRLVQSEKYTQPPRSGGEFRYKNFLWPNGFNSGCFQLHTSQNVAKSMPSLTSQSCGDSLPSVCLAGQVEAINRPPKHPWTPDRPANEASVKADR